MINLPNLGLFGDFANCEQNLIQAINRNFFVLDSVTHLGVTAFLTEPPDLPELGDIFILSGPVEGFNFNSIYAFDGANWIEVPPKLGMITYVQNEELFYFYNGFNWEVLETGGGAGGNRLNFLADGSFEEDELVDAWETTVGASISISSNSVLTTPENKKSALVQMPPDSSVSFTFDTEGQYQGRLVTFEGLIRSDYPVEITLLNQSKTINPVSSFKMFSVDAISDGTPQISFKNNTSENIEVYVDELYFGPKKISYENLNIKSDITSRNAIALEDRYPGMTVTVTNDGSGVVRDYQLVGGIDNANWVIKTRNMFGQVSLSISTFAGGEIAAESFEANHTYVNVTCTTNTSILALPETISRDKKISVRSDSASTGRFFVSGASLLGYGTEPTLSLEPNELLHFDYVKAIDKWILSGRVL